jgi:hypothetical protein
MTQQAHPQWDASYTAAVEFKEFLSRSVCQLVTSVGWLPRR